MINLTKKTGIPPHEEAEIAMTLQFLLTSELFSKKQWHAPNAVFHGGTSLAMMYGTGRFSEDLDFMIDESLFEGLEKTMKSVAKRIQITARAIYPGCSIDLIGPKGNAVQSWFFGWTHPMRHGKVKVKAEFLSRPQDLLKGYLTAQSIPVGPSHIPINISATINGPRLTSAWADKIVAISQRPAFKWRDVYDLWFIDKKMKDNSRDEADADYAPYPSDETFFDSLDATAGIYSNTPDDILEGLKAVMDKGYFDQKEEYAKDMARWFPKETWQRWNPHVFDIHLNMSKKQVLKAIELLQIHKPVMMP